MYVSLGPFAAAASFVIVFTSCQQLNQLGDFDEVETYTRILLHSKNGSLMNRPRADPGGPLIIDYPFPIHHHPPAQHPEYPVRPPTHVHQISHYPQLPSTDTHESLTSWHNYGSGLKDHHSLFFPPRKKKKKFLKKSSKYLIPLIITLVAKIGHLLPTLKLILLALFSLLLFAKKAFLVSVGTFLLVLYEHFTSKNTSSVGFNSIGLWKDRGQPAPAEVHPTFGEIQIGGSDNKSGADWWHLEGSNGTKIAPRRRWWAPQVRVDDSYPTAKLPPQLEEQVSLKERIKDNLKRIFGEHKPTAIK